MVVEVIIIKAATMVVLASIITTAISYSLLVIHLATRQEK